MRRTKRPSSAWLALAAVAFAAACSARTQTPLSVARRVPSIAEIDSKLAALRPALRSYPPTIASEEQRDELERRWHEAEDALKLYSEAHPDQSHVEYRMGELYIFGHNLDIKGAADNCVAHLQRAVALQPDYAEAYLELGIFYTEAGPRWGADGETNLRKAIDLSRPTPVPRAWRALSFAYYYQAKFAQAVSAADRYLLLVPNDEGMREIKQLSQEAAARGDTKVKPVGRFKGSLVLSPTPQNPVQ